MTPQRVQGSIITRYAEKHHLKVVFNLAEANLGSQQLVLGRALHDVSGQVCTLDLIFYTIDQLPSLPELKNQLFDLIAKKKLRLHFALEELIAFNTQQLEDLMFMVWLAEYSRKFAAQIIQRI